MRLFPSKFISCLITLHFALLFGGCFNIEPELNIESEPEPRKINHDLKIPDHFASIQINTTESYVASIIILDVYGKKVSEWEQKFEYSEVTNDRLNGPAQNINQDGSIRTFLVWNLLDLDFNPAENGIYVWKVHVEFQTKPAEDMTIEQGIITTYL